MAPPGRSASSCQASGGGLVTMIFGVSFEQGATWLIAGVATLGVITRPWNLPEALWAVLGASALLLLGLLPPEGALRGIAKGTDVYLFLIGMMLLAEIAREEGLFDWLPRHARPLPPG